jgi:hypothetical protein
MAQGIWTVEGCKPVAQAAAIDCQSFGAEWGNGANAYSAACTSYLVGASNTYTLTIKKCTNATCAANGSISRSGTTCDTDATTGPFHLSKADSLQLGSLIIAVWIAGAVTRWLIRALDNSPGSTN